MLAPDSNDPAADVADAQKDTAEDVQAAFEVHLNTMSGDQKVVSVYPSSVGDRNWLLQS